VQKIINQMHKRNQTILFSATENPKQQNIIDNLVKQYKKVKVSEGKANSDNIYQEVIKPKDDVEKNQMLVDLLRKKEFKKVLIFSETKRQVSKLCRVLKKFDLKVDEIHGNKSQQYRSKAIQKFKLGTIQIMVATDVASRGIDIDNITHVINYRIPSSKESYIHRIGRTGEEPAKRAMLLLSYRSLKFQTKNTKLNKSHIFLYHTTFVSQKSKRLN